MPLLRVEHHGGPRRSLELKPKAHLDGEKQGSCGEEAFFFPWKRRLQGGLLYVYTVYRSVYLYCTEILYVLVLTILYYIRIGITQGPSFGVY
jgi:hypothetical protein